jgi:hypothetical protein
MELQSVRNCAIASDNMQDAGQRSRRQDETAPECEDRGNAGAFIE